MEDKISKMLNRMDEKMLDLTNKMSEVSKSVIAHDNELKFISKKLDDMETFQRRKILRFDGIGENDNENLMSIMINILNNSMKVKCSSSDICNLYRQGKLIRGSNNARIVVIEFVSLLKKNEILKARKELKQTKIFVYEDLTKCKYALLKKAKKLYGQEHVWSFGGNIFAKIDNQIKKLESKDYLL
ncbi:unnamed protein product [Psylliodes chrysocephalus]|uniref:Uncharacterized protein n=1 Tax=Psylliodes chrysocephalus TaxID=3402493 RepID=A0A9P0CCT3_9CUCU|nr:unnamed protein product [Psylliodes chrysocephala]